MVVVVMSQTLSSMVKSFWSSVTAAVAVGFSGSVILIIWTPWSLAEATRAYVEGPMVVVVMPTAPSSLVKPSWSFLTAAVAVGFSGSVISIIWTPSSWPEATRAYVEGPMVVVVICQGESRLVKPPRPSVTAAVAVGFLGSVDIDYLDAVVGVRGYQGVRVVADGGSGDAPSLVKHGKAVLAVCYGSCRCRVFGVCDIDYLDTVVDVRCYQGVRGGADGGSGYANGLR